MKSKKKKRIGMLLAYCMFILLGVTSVSVTSKAEDTDDGYTYYVEYVGGGYATITGYTGTDTELVIPEEVGGYKVTAIDAGSFSECSSLTSVEIPEGVKTILGRYDCEGAFYNCSNLKTVKLPTTLKSIGDNAFYGCSSLEDITIPKGVTEIEGSTFKDCSSLKSIVIPEGLTDIWSHAFENCSSLTSIVIPEGVTSIGYDAFKGCSNLTNVTIPSSVTSKYSDAFADTPWYKNIVENSKDGLIIINNILIDGSAATGDVVIPEGVTSIRRGAFNYCSSLTSLTIPASVTDLGVSIECGMLSGITVKAGNENYYSEGNCIISKDYELVMGCKNSIIPKEVTSIGEAAFSGCYSLENLIIPEGVTSIGEAAFSGCSSLTSVAIPKGVTRIESAAFRGCSSLTSVAIPKGVTRIESATFYGCSSLTSVTIPRSVSHIAVDGEYYGAFSNAELLVYSAPDSYAASWAENQGYDVEEIVSEGEEFKEGDNKYQYCVLSNNTVEIIGYTGTSKKLEIPATINGMAVTSIAGYAFSGCEVQNITIPSSVTNIEYGALVGLSSLIGITVAEGNEYYYSSGNCLISKEGELIAGCKKSVIPAGVKSIGKHAFRGCEFNSYDDVVIPNGVTHIGDFAFDESPTLKNITIPSSVISIGRGTIGQNYTDMDGDKFSTCIHAVPGSYAAEWAKKNDYDLMSLSQTYEDGDGTYEYTVLDDGTIRIDACFSEQEEIEVPAMIDGKTVTSIGRRAFTECEYYLTSISIPDSVTSIGEYAFSECISLSYVNISSSSNLTSIGDYAFAVCDNIETITIPDGVTSIGEGAFSDCESLTSIVIPNGVTNIKKNTFNSCCSLESVSLPPSMTNIGEAAFSGCDMLQNITLPEGLKTIAKDTFSCCAGLTDITIPSTVTSIGEAAFSGCSGLTNIMIPASVTNINKAAFDGCKGLTGVEVAEENEVYYSDQNCIIRKDNAELVLGCKNSIIPNNVKSIGACAFSGCMGLRSITIPNGVISIGDCAFSNCKGLTSITIPDSVVNFGEYAIDGNEDDFVIYASADSAAAKWAKENGFDVSSPKDDDPSGGNDNPGTDNPSGGNDNPGTNNPSGGNTGNGTTTDTTTPGGTTPAAVGTVLKGAVANVTVTSDQEGNPTVEYTAVANKKAKTVTIPDSVTVDGITYKVTSVSAKAFAGCKKATKITIGANVTSIGKNAFKECKAVKTITIKSTKLAKNAFAKAGVKKLSKKVTIKVPKSCKKNYKKQLEKAGFKGKIK
ncbi:MAG: leucine-rich repeat protein [Lachnospiraceae bacterium]